MQDAAFSAVKAELFDVIAPSSVILFESLVVVVHVDAVSRRPCIRLASLSVYYGDPRFLHSRLISIN